ncbi:MAG: MIP/aquaporin family protein [Pseudomonadota bacterium]
MTRKLFAEWLGSFLLTATVIGSGILAVEVSAGNDGVALLGNTLATAAILFVLVTTLGPVSGAHFNPAVTLAFLLRGEISPPGAINFVVVQILGCVMGAWFAHFMFELAILQLAETDRSGLPKIVAESAATFALVFAILGTLKWRPEAVPMAVGLTIAAGYWWTASTSFANPAISIARALSDTFAGVQLSDVPGFVVGQYVGAVLAVGAAHVLFKKTD